jgi:hypothetical protein
VKARDGPASGVQVKCGALEQRIDSALQPPRIPGNRRWPIAAPMFPMSSAPWLSISLATLSPDTDDGL